MDHKNLDGASIAFLVAPEGAEQVELTKPWQAVVSAGGRPQLISTTRGRVQAFQGLDRGDTFEVDATLEEADPDDYAALVLPGGVANPDYLRTQRPAVAFVDGFFSSGRPVAAICHAPWTLIETGVLPGRTLTSWPSLHTDIVNAGGTWVDKEVVVCTGAPSTLVTSRKPDDLPAFCDRMISVFGEAMATRS